MSRWWRHPDLSSKRSHWMWVQVVALLWVQAVFWVTPVNKHVFVLRLILQLTWFCSWEFSASISLWSCLFWCNFAECDHSLGLTTHSRMYSELQLNHSASGLSSDLFWNFDDSRNMFGVLEFNLWLWVTPVILVLSEVPLSFIGQPEGNCHLKRLQPPPGRVKQELLW